MPNFFADVPPVEASDALTFAGNRLNRWSEKRDSRSLVRALEHPRVRFLAAAKSSVFVDFGTAAPRVNFSRDELETLAPKMASAVLLGFDRVGPIVAVPVGCDPEEAPGTMKSVDFRSLAILGLLREEEMGIVAQAGALLAWNASHGYCSRCGTMTDSGDGGYRRYCPNCETDHFPRTDPVVIMLGVQGERCLLGRNHNFPEKVYSTLAGFVEPGETIENAVRRETLEESGIEIGRVRYFGTQPWPFPYSLMIGCYGEALTRDIDMDTEELEDCRWFSRKQVLAALDGDGASKFLLPPKMAIAHHLIRHWATDGEWPG